MHDPWSSVKTGDYLSRYHYGKNASSCKSTKKINWKRMGKSFCQDLQNYTENTTLHGFRYLSSDEVTFGGKFIWLVVCLVSFSLSIVLMFTAWNKYQITPTVTSIESTTHPIWGLKFPAVTICNFNKVYEPRAKKMAEKMKTFGLNDTEIKDYFDALPKMIREEYLMKDFSRTVEILDAMEPYSSDALMFRLMQPCDQLIIECSWLGVYHDCAKVFKTVRTSHGFCCAFNYHVIGGEFPPDSGGFVAKDQHKWNISTQPGVHEVQMVPGAGRDTGLTVYIDVEAHTYRASTRPYVGAAILIHDPFIYPEINIQTVVVQPAQEISVIVRGNVIESEESVRDLSLKRRKCWFKDEVQLNTTMEYSYQSCISECRMKHIVAFCRCLPFYYPFTVDFVKRCDLLDIQCLRSYSDILSKLQTPFHGAKLNGSSSSTTLPQCSQCLPPCSTNGYTVETETAVLTHDHNIKDKSKMKKPEYSVVTVFFPDITCLKYRRETFMTWDNLLASFGGIFGLCIGGSFVSFVEIFYYMIIWLFRRKRADSIRKSLPVRSVDTYEMLERQPVATMKNVPIKNWMNSEHFQSGSDYNFNGNKVPSRVIGFSPKPLNKATFTIELSDVPTKLHPRFIRM